MNEIIGHTEVLRRLRSGLVSGNLPHASLFLGPSGVGKLTVARRYAQAVLCRGTRDGETLSGCQKCPSCHKVDVRCHADLQWVEKEEGKTRISVEQIRDLTKFLSLTPLESAWKVAVVDDAADMNAAAANALLKTLEEPPANSILILVTSRPGMLLATILSRCVKFHFQSLSKEDFSRILRIKTGLDDALLETVVDYSEGDLGFALRFIQEDALVECDKLTRELDGLMKDGRLIKLCEVADYWSQPGRFSLAGFVVRRWLMETVRKCVVSGTAPGRVREWLAVETFARDVFVRAEAFNVNKRLLLEGVFIKILRISGAVL